MKIPQQGIAGRSAPIAALHAGKEESALKNVRIWFEKDGTSRFISHLDLNRCMSRAIHRSGLPIWYTEGFNPHPFLTFALPLSLGVRGKRESMDIKLEEDMPEQEIIERMNPCLPEGIRVFAVTEPVMKPGRISYARYEMTLTAEACQPQQILQAVQKVMDMPQIIVSKKTKSGMKEMDLKESLGEYQLVLEQDGVLLCMLLPAGSSNNVNPQLLLEAVKQYEGMELYADITRLDLYDGEKNPFC